MATDAAGPVSNCVPARSTVAPKTSKAGTNRASFTSRARRNALNTINVDGAITGNTSGYDDNMIFDGAGTVTLGSANTWRGSRGNTRPCVPSARSPRG